MNFRVVCRNWVGVATVVFWACLVGCASPTRYQAKDATGDTDSGGAQANGVNGDRGKVDQQTSPGDEAGAKDVVAVPSGDATNDASAVVTPTADASVADAFIADGSVTDAIAVADVSAADRPVADASVADASVADASVADLSVMEAPRADAAAVDATIKDAQVEVNAAECTSGAKKCVGLQPQLCDATGRWQNSGSPCTFICANATGTCTGSCVPDARKCNNSQPQLCDATGAWKDTGSACTGCSVCSNPTGTCVAATANTACNDGNACTQADSCQSGTCVGTPLTCPAPAACHVAGTCSNGTCSTPNMADGLADTKCPTSARLCFSGACVQCLSDADCSGNTPSCNLTTHSCGCRKPSPGNLVKNPGFDSDLSGWSQINVVGSVTWSADDSEGCPGSGSAAGDTEGDPQQCVPVVAGRSYYFGVKFKRPLANNQHYCELRYVADSECKGAQVSTNDNTKIGPIVNDEGDGWALYSTTVQVPAGAQGALIQCYMLTGKMDQIYINAGDNKF